MTKVQNIENLQIVFYILKDLKEKRLKVAKISKEAGLNPNNVHKWGKRNSVISFEDGLKIYQWALKTDYSPKDWVSSIEQDQTRFANLSDIEAGLRELADAVRKIDSKKAQTSSLEEGISDNREILKGVHKGTLSKKDTSGMGSTKT